MPHRQRASTADPSVQARRSAVGLSRVTAAAILLSIGISVPAAAADIAAGQQVFEHNCAACHQLKGYAGKSDAELEAALKGMVAGTVAHPKKLTLSPADIADVAAYISSNEAP